MSKFSIIIPVYNVATELPRAIASVSNQSFGDWELILVNDGSADNSLEVCKSAAATDGRIIVIEQDNQGVVAARYHGFKKSSGEWILFLDGDDEFAPGILVKLDTIVSSCDIDVIQFGFDILRNGRSEGSSATNEGILTTDDILAQMVKTPLEVLSMCIGNKCYRRDVACSAFKDVGEVRIAHSEDGLFAMAAFVNAERIYFLRKAYYKYIIRNSSTLHRVNKNIVTEKQQFIDTIQRLAVDSKRFSCEHIQRMLEFHAYEASCYIFLMLTRNKADVRTCLCILKALAHTEFFNIRNREWRGMKRMIMRWVIMHPIVYLAASRSRIIR
jgi:glycosyltransferase involved in cell wall biosynthesis